MSCLLDNGSFPEIVDAIVRVSDFHGLRIWRSISRYHRSVADSVLFAHVHVYERDPYGSDAASWAICARGVRWPFWSWTHTGASPSAALPLPFQQTRVLDLSWHGGRGKPAALTVPPSLLAAFDPHTVRLVAFRGSYPSFEYVWPRARLIAFADVSTTHQRSERDVRVPGPRDKTVLHLKYDSRRDTFFRLLAIPYTFPTFMPTHDVTVIISPDRPGPESLLDRRKTVVQVLKRLGYWIRYGSKDEWAGPEVDTEYRITMVVDGINDHDALTAEPRETALRAGWSDGHAIQVPPMPVTFVTHDEFRDHIGYGEWSLHCEWPKQPSGRICTLPSAWGR